MPVTVRLSRKFYERFGDEVTGELVDLLNTIDASYRADYRELLDARLAQFAAELRHEMGALSAQLRQEMRELSAELRQEMGELGAELRQEMRALRSEMTALETRLKAEMDLLRAELTVRLKTQETRLIRWMFGLWISAMLALAGTVAALLAAIAATRSG
jgi:phage host-nuclease inhibitor protein Gam